MKKILLLGGLFVVAVLILLVTALHLRIGGDVKKNISIATSIYPGAAEDALIAYLQDDTNEAIMKTHLAIWSLGQIRSDKAQPILKPDLCNSLPITQLNCFEIKYLTLR